MIRSNGAKLKLLIPPAACLCLVLLLLIAARNPQGVQEMMWPSFLEDDRKCGTKIMRYMNHCKKWLYNETPPAVNPAKSSAECAKVDWNKVLCNAEVNKFIDPRLKTCVPSSHTPMQIFQLNEFVEAPPPPPAANSSSCGYTYHMSRRIEYFHMMKYWLKKSAELDVPWFIVGGTLLGSYRYKDFLPWDHDMDIQIGEMSESILREYQSPRRRNKVFTGKLNWVTRPGAYCYGNRRDWTTSRQDCSGSQVTSEVDKCGFCTPFARIFHQDINTQWIDIFKHSVVKTHRTNRITILVEDHPARVYIPMNSIYPLKLCPFMGLQLPCPNDIPRYLCAALGPNFQTPDRYCDPKTKEWRLMNEG